MAWLADGEVRAVRAVVANYHDYGHTTNTTVHTREHDCANTVDATSARLYIRK